MNRIPHLTRQDILLPDISHYSNIMTGSRFAFGLDLYLVFSLIKAIIEAAYKTSELSKPESDAALYLPIQKN